MFQDDSEPWSIQQLFKFLDHNKDGHIDAHDLAAICASTNVDAPMDEVNTLFFLSFLFILINPKRKKEKRVLFHLPPTHTHSSPPVKLLLSICFCQQNHILFSLSYIYM